MFRPEGPVSEPRQSTSQSDSGIGRTVLADLRRADLHRSVWRDLQDLYAFYLDDDERERLARMSRLQRSMATVGWLLRRLILSLGPARRILLMVAFGLGGYGLLDDRVSIVALGFAALLLVLMFELRDKLLARDELEVGRAVQLALLPADNPQLPGWDLWLYSRPANDVGGDVLDYLQLGEARLGLTLGDVAGKGLGAALLAAKLQSTLRALATDVGSLVGLCERTNRIFHRDGLPNRFATLIFAEIRSDSGTVRFVNAGHMPPIALIGGQLTTTDPVALPLGIKADAQYSEQQMHTTAGDFVVIYSDGLSEATNNADAMFGDDRVAKLVGTLAGLTAEQAGRKILSSVNDFVGDARPHDDLSLAILRRVE